MLNFLLRKVIKSIPSFGLIYIQNILSGKVEMCNFLKCIISQLFNDIKEPNNFHFGKTNVRNLFQLFSLLSKIFDIDLKLHSSATKQLGNY